MNHRPSSAAYVEILLFTLSSLLLYHTGIGFVLYLAPLQILASRRGIRALGLAEALFFAVFLVIRFWPTVVSPLHELPGVLETIEIVVAAVCGGGMILVNLPLRRRPRTLYRLLAATGLAGVVAVPAVLVLAGSPAFQQAMRQLFTEVAGMLSRVFSGPDGSGSALSTVIQPERLRIMTEAVLVRSLLADYLVLLSFSWWAGQAAARRVPLLGAPTGFRLSGFHLESGWLWPLIASGALVLVDLFFGSSALAGSRALPGIHPLTIVAWNVALALLFLFGLQGLAIVRFLFEKYHLPRLLWVLLVAGLFVLAASPGAGLFIVLMIPVLGISENWIRYRIPRKAAE